MCKQKNIKVFIIIKTLFKHGKKLQYINYIENNTWLRGNTIFISSVEHNIMFNTRNK